MSKINITIEGYGKIVVEHENRPYVGEELEEIITQTVVKTMDLVAPPKELKFHPVLGMRAPNYE